MSKRVAMIKCNFHNDTRPSMAIYLNENNTYTFYCFGCKQYGVVRDTSDFTTFLPKTNRQRDLKEITIQKNHLAFLTSRGISKDLAYSYGIKFASNFLMLPCYQLHNGIIKEVGFILRKLHGEPKYISKKGLNYSLVPNSINNKMIFLVESIFDGLSLYEKFHVPSVAILGLAIQNSDVYSILSNIKHIIIIFDHDAELRSVYLRDKLRLLGFNVTSFTPKLTPYKLDKTEIEKLKNILEGTYENSY